MALNKITYDNKVALSPQPSVANINKVSDADMNEIKSIVNASIDEVNYLENVATGPSTINTETISGAEINRYIKIGRLCIFNFTMTAKAGWSSTALLASNLPKPLYGTRSFGLNTSTNVALRFSINTSGELHNAYSHTIPNNTQIIEGQIIYITED